MKRLLLTTLSVLLLAPPAAAQRSFEMCVAADTSLQHDRVVVSAAGDTALAATGARWRIYDRLKSPPYALGIEWREPLVGNGIYWARQDETVSVPTNELTYLTSLNGVPAFTRAGEDSTVYLPVSPAGGACKFAVYKNTGSREKPAPSAAELRVVRASDIEASKQLNNFEVIEVRLARGFTDIVVRVRASSNPLQAWLAEPGHPNAFYLTDPGQRRYPLLSQQGWKGPRPAGSERSPCPPGARSA